MKHEYIGKMFGHLTVIEQVENASNGVARFNCDCSCGGTAIVRKGRLLSGETKSCGCASSKDETGNRYGELTVINKVGLDKYRQYLWLCRCNCGGQIILRGYTLRAGKKDHCGCLTFERLKQSNTIHGLNKTKVHRTWSGMKARCNDVNDDSYGGRGISYSKSWEQFQTFLYDMGFPPTEQHQIDRIDNNKGYCKENCRWVTRNINTTNTSKSRKWIVYGILYETMKEAIKTTKLSRWKIQNMCHKNIKHCSTVMKYSGGKVL